MRTQLTAPLTLYVSPSGSDSNDGLTPATALKTRQAAWNLLATNYDLALQPVTIQLTDGTYTDDFTASGPLVGSGLVTFQGNVTTPDSCIINASLNAFTALDYACFYVKGFKVSATGPAGNCLVAGNLGRITFGVMDFGQSNGEHLAVFMGGQIVGDGSNYTISGGANDHWKLDSWGVMLINPCAVSIPAPVNFTYFHRNGAAWGCFKGVTFSGAGLPLPYSTKYGINENATTLIGGVSPSSFFPGAYPGSVAADSLLE